MPRLAWINMSNENDSARGADSGKRVSVAMSNTGDAAAAAAHGNFWKALWRTKNYSSVMHTPLHRCFSTFDLTLFSIGNLLGGSVFVITGVIVREKSGPAVVISFLIAGIAAMLISFAYAELASRLPKAGSAYTYTYVVLGEFLAFVIGWSVILEYILGFSSVSKGWSATLDSMLDHAISKSIQESMPMNSQWLSKYPDFVAFAISVLVCVLVCSGARISATFINVTTIINLFSIAFVTVVMLIHGSWNNVVNLEGGFMPRGFREVISGSATAFYAFIGFDAAAIASEEVENPARTIPIAMFSSIIISTVGLVLSSFSLVYFTPYYNVTSTSAFTDALFDNGFYWEGMVTGVGALIGLTASLVCSAYAMPRVVYAIAHDGLIFRSLGYIYERTKVPITAIAVTGLLVSVLALLFSFEVLANFLSIGTLIAYSIVNCDLITLRFSKPKRWMNETALLLDEFSAEMKPNVDENQKSAENGETTKLRGEETEESNKKYGLVESSSSLLETPIMTDEGDALRVGTLKPCARTLPLPDFVKNASAGTVPFAALAVFLVFGVGFSVILLDGKDSWEKGSWWGILLLTVCGLVVIATNALMLCYEQNEYIIKTFKVPYVPVLPSLSIILNVMLIVMLDYLTWVRFGIWLFIGLVIYFFYGADNSSENEVEEEEIFEETNITTDEVVE